MKLLSLLLVLATLITPTPTTSVDRCEPNDSMVAPCALPSETDHHGFDFSDDGIDVFSFLLEQGRNYHIQVNSEQITTAISVFRAGDEQRAVARSSSVTQQTEVQFTPDRDGWYLVVVELRGEAHQSSQYSLSAKSQLTASSLTPTPSSRGDAYENNYNLETAAALAWGVPYDLSLICPDVGACRSGDHDFFMVPVKPGVPFVAATYDLGPGCDTTIAAYRPQPGYTDPSTGIANWQMVQGNDDLVIGETLRSQILFTPDWSGDLLLIVAPSPRREPPALPASSGPAGRYRLIVGSPALPSVREVISSDLPSSTVHTATATAAPASAAMTAVPAPVANTDSQELIHEACTNGVAVVQPPQAPFYAAAPATPQRLLAYYPQGAQINLLGQCYLGWVKVQPFDSVTPGWMFAPDLRLESTAHSAPTQQSKPANPAETPGLPATDTATPIATAAPSQLLQVTPLDQPFQAADLPLAGKPIQLSISVTNTQKQPRVGVLLQFINLFGDRLAEALTPNNGTVSVPIEWPEGTQLLLRVPSYGVEIPLDPAQPQLNLVIGGQP